MHREHSDQGPQRPAQHQPEVSHVERQPQQRRQAQHATHGAGRGGEGQRDRLRLRGHDGSGDSHRPGHPVEAQRYRRHSVVVELRPAIDEGNGLSREQFLFEHRMCAGPGRLEIASAGLADRVKDAEILPGGLAHHLVAQLGRRRLSFRYVLLQLEHYDDILWPDAGNATAK